MRKSSEKLLVFLHEMQHTIYSLEADNIDGRIADNELRVSHNHFNAVHEQWRREVLEGR